LKGWLKDCCAGATNGEAGGKESKAELGAELEKSESAPPNRDEASLMTGAAEKRSDVEVEERRLRLSIGLGSVAAGTGGGTAAAMSSLGEPKSEEASATLLVLEAVRVRSG
jgi:hypothetical protein